MSHVLECKDLCKTYVVNKHQNNVLRNINLTIEEGEMAAVMGPSGSGKSTLLYTASGMDQPTAGEIIFNGRHIDKVKENEMSDIRLDEMGFIFQQMYMLKNLTILDNIILPSCQSKKKKESHKEITKRALSYMRKLNIVDIAEHDINEVSGGQLQRACICRSLMNQPQMIFADEPTGALNRSSSEEVMEELRKISKEGTAVMLVTHDVRVAAKCERILYIVDGSIKGEYTFEKELMEEERMGQRERTLNHWLMDMGY